jgi:SAM-dependent methyltransferase
VSTTFRNFDTTAATWDDVPRRLTLARDVAAAIRKQIPLTPQTDMLDFACGTGLVSMQLHPFARSIVGMDSSQGMLDVFAAKAAKLPKNTVRTQFIDVAHGDVLTGTYDLIVCSMAFHHMPDVAPILSQFYACTRSGGYLCVADLDPEDGRFHEDHTGVFHDGFERSVLFDAFVQAGYREVTAVTAAEVIKGNAQDRFSIFLITGRK